MRKTTGILLLCLFSMLAFSQQGIVYTPAQGDTTKIYPDSSIPYPETGVSGLQARPRFALETGMFTTFSTGNRGGSGVFTSAFMHYPVSRKFSIETGFRLERSNLLHYGTFGEYPVYPWYSLRTEQPFLRSMLFARGKYLVHPDLTISVTTYRETFSGSDLRINPRAVDFGSYGASAGFEYRFNERFRIGAEIGIRQGSYPSNIISPYPFYFPISNPSGFQLQPIGQ